MNFADHRIATSLSALLFALGQPACSGATGEDQRDRSAEEAAGSALTGADSGADGADAGGSTPVPLSQVKRWAYQIQHLDNTGAVTPLVSSRYDMLVLE